MRYELSDFEVEMKFLVTGAQGQLARQFQKTLQMQEYPVVAFDREGLDISDSQAVRERISEHVPDVVINCASYNLVDKAEDDFDTARSVNATGVKNLAIACKENNVLLIHYSTDYVFDGTKEAFYTEEDEPNPINKYGESKQEGEQLLRHETDNYLLFRVSWVFGEGRSNFLSRLSEWAQKNRTLKIVSDQVSVPTYTEDIVHVTLFALNKGLRGLYHLTNSGYASRYEVARYYIEQMGMDNLVLPVTSAYFPSPAKRPYFSALSNRKLSRELNVDIPDWQLGIERYVKTILAKTE
jgi:dTDP-4-dehydrorhamnose reductase